MKYVYSIKRSIHLISDQLKDILPLKFSLQEEGEQLTIVIEHENEIDEKQVYYELQRECDRIFFLTGIQLDPRLIRIERPDGSKRVGDELGVILRGIEQLPSDLDRQQWKQTLADQLRLWQLANLPYLPISVQIILLFQIIESSYPNTYDPKEYPKYKDITKPPHPRTEAKLIRDWVSHRKKKVDDRGKQLKKYCNHLRIKEEFFNPTDAIHQQIIPKLHEKVKTEAEKIIKLAISKKPMNAIE